MIHIARVNVGPANRSCIVDASGICALEGACARVRSVEDGDCAVRSPQVAVPHIVRVKGKSRDRSCRIEAIDGTHEGTCRARGIEAGDGAICSAHEPVTHRAGVTVMARDHACRVDVRGNGALAGACPRARSIECGNGAARSAQEAVVRIARFSVRFPWSQPICSCLRAECPGRGQCPRQEHRMW